MPNFKTKQECAAFLLTKKNQGFISSPTWNKILESWRKCTSLEEYISLTKAVFKQIALANRIYPVSYFA